MIKASYWEIDQCRICGSSHLEPVLDLGVQKLTGVFPRSREEVITSGPLELVRCDDSQNPAACGLLQLRHSYDSTELYGANYGYRSGLNQSMVSHLKEIARKAYELAAPQPGDLVLDIGSNDSTLLQAFSGLGLDLVGIDPTGTKFKQFYPPHIQLIPDFFSADSFRKQLGPRQAKIITSIAMFYDLAAPLDFMRQVHQVLAEDGVWVFEQSYMPAMLEANAYDTVCHEHLEYYSLRQIIWLTDLAGFKIIAVELNETNGGSFCVTAARTEAIFPEAIQAIRQILTRETEMSLSTPAPYQSFAARVFQHHDQLCETLHCIKRSGQTVLGYGASTKGNVLLQFCHLAEGDIPMIAEVNPDKFGCYTPGTLIPIISEVAARAMNPDYFLVLPWHFRSHIVAREQEYLSKGGKLIFPLPKIEIVGQKG